MIGAGVAVGTVVVVVGVVGAVVVVGNVVAVVVVVGMVVVVVSADGVTVQQVVEAGDCSCRGLTPPPLTSYWMRAMIETDVGDETQDAGKLIPYVLGLPSKVAWTPDVHVAVMVMVLLLFTVTLPTAPANCPVVGTLTATAANAGAVLGSAPLVHISHPTNDWCPLAQPASVAGSVAVATLKVKPIELDVDE